MKLDLNSETPAGLPLTVGVEGDQLVMRIGVDTLAVAFMIGEANHTHDDDACDFRRDWKVIDRHKFAAGVARGMCVEDEDGSTPLTRVIDDACTVAVEDDMGVDEDGRLVTEIYITPQETK